MEVTVDGRQRVGSTITAVRAVDGTRPPAAGRLDGVSVPVDLVLPVKELHRAKSRLAPSTATLPGSADDRARAHRDLAQALVRDTLAAVLEARVRQVVVVTGDPAALADVVPAGVIMITDPGHGLNAAIRRAASHRRAEPPGLVASLQADLPALRPDELDEALTQAGQRLTGPDEPPPAVFVADHLGTGTTLLVTGPGRRVDPRFGPASAAAHRAAGAQELDGAWPGLRTDVDTPDDLDAVQALGTGPATRAWLSGTTGSTEPVSALPGC